MLHVICVLTKHLVYDYGKPREKIGFIGLSLDLSDGYCLLVSSPALK
jgi:hypothetical protein